MIVLANEPPAADFVAACVRVPLADYCLIKNVLAFIVVKMVDF
jgi:hypothetical protein